jgi:hypothetical protein
MSIFLAFFTTRMRVKKEGPMTFVIDYSKRQKGSINDIFGGVNSKGSGKEKRGGE